MDPERERKERAALLERQHAAVAPVDLSSGEGLLGQVLRDLLTLILGLTPQKPDRPEVWWAASRLKNTADALLARGGQEVEEYREPHGRGFYPPAKEER